MSKKIVLLITLAGMAIVTLTLLATKIQPQGGEQSRQKRQQKAFNNQEIPKAANQAIIPTEDEPELKNKEPIDTEIDTSDWNTYRNKEYGFQIRFPNNWEKKDYGQNVIISPYDPEATREHTFIRINIKPNPENKDIREFYNGAKERALFTQSDNEYEKGQIKQYHYFKFVPYITFAGEVIIVVQLNDAFIELVDSRSTYQQNGIFNAIFSTFEFLE